MGQIVSGVLAKSSHEYHTAQLVGWSGASASDWKMLPPRTFPVNGIELSLHDVYRLPVLNQRHFPSPAEPPSLDFTLALKPDALQVSALHHARQAPALPPVPLPPSTFPATVGELRAAHALMTAQLSPPSPSDPNPKPVIPDPLSRSEPSSSPDANLVVRQPISSSGQLTVPRLAPGHLTVPRLAPGGTPNAPLQSGHQKLTLTFFGPVISP